MADPTYNNGVVSKSYDISDNIKGNSTVDLNKIKQVINSGEGNLADALRTGVEANQQVGPLGLAAFLSRALGDNKDTAYGLSGRLGNENNYIESLYRKQNIDAIDQALTTKALEARLKYGDGILKGRYVDNEGPFGSKNTTKAIEGSYMFNPNLKVKADYSDTNTNYGMDSIEKGLALEYALKNGAISARYGDKNDRPNWGVNFAMQF